MKAAGGFHSENEQRAANNEMKIKTSQERSEKHDFNQLHRYGTTVKK